jgi:type IV pilus assembly protein PilM
MFKRPLIAIDIGSSAVKIVELSGGSQKKLLSMGMELVPAGAIVDGNIANAEVVAELVRNLLKRLNISPRGRRVALSLGGSSVLMKRVLIGASENTLEEQIYYDVQQHFQIDPSEIYYDYALMTADNPEVKDTPVLLVGSKRDLVENYIGMLHTVGMKAGVIECDVFSVSNMFEYNYGVVEALTAIVNVGANVTQVALLFRGEYVYTRDIAVAGEEYTRKIMDALGCDRPNAELLKIGASLGSKDVPPEVAPIINEINEQLVSEVHLTVDYFIQSGDIQTGALSSVFLTGGGARVLGLDAALAAVLQVPVQVINPFQRVDVNPRKFNMDTLMQQGHLYGVAVGLGLRAIGDKSA